MSSSSEAATKSETVSRPCCCCNRCRSVCPCSCATFLVVFFRLFLLSFLGVSIFLVVFFWAPLSDAFVVVIEYLDDQPTQWKALILLAANVVAALMFLPCLPFTMAAGYLLRPIRGTIIIALASTIAAVIAFLIGRYLARSLVEKSLGNKTSKWRVIDNAINGDGFRIVFLIRLSPIHPYAIMNYLFGLTSVSLRDYTFASFFAMLPTTMMEVYSGAQLKKLDDALRGDASALSSAMLAAGFVVTVVVTVIITVWVRRILQKELSRYAPVSEEEEEEDVVLELDDVDVTGDETEESEDATPKTVDGSDPHVYTVKGTEGQSMETPTVKDMEDEEKTEGSAVDHLPQSSAAVDVTAVNGSLGSSRASPMVPGSSPSSAASSTASSVVVSPVPVQRRVVRQSSSPNVSPSHPHSPPLTSPVHFAIRSAGSSSPSLSGTMVGSSASTGLLTRSLSSSSVDSEGGQGGGGEQPEGEKLIKNR